MIPCMICIERIYLTAHILRQCGQYRQEKLEKMAKKTFESALAQLEQITEEMEAGDLSLDSSLKKFDEGIKLADFCNKKLSDARARVELLLDKNGTLTTEPFDGSDSDD